MSKIQTLQWYLKQKGGYKLAWNLFLGKTFYRSKEVTRDVATKWCAENAINTIEFFEQHYPGQVSLEDPFSVFPDSFEYARKKVKETPYTLGGAGNTLLLYNYCKVIKAKKVLETGVAYGWSSLSILLAIQHNPGAMLYSTDMPYANMGNDDFVGIVVPDELRKQWELFREADITGLPKILKRTNSLDLVHYDSDKTYLGRMQSYPKLWNHLRPGGVFISDDIQDNIAFRDFSEKLGIQPYVISFEDKYVGILIK